MTRPFECKEKCTCSEPLRMWYSIIKNNLQGQFPKQRSALPLLAVSLVLVGGIQYHGVKCKHDTV